MQSQISYFDSTHLFFFYWFFFLFKHVFQSFLLFSSSTNQVLLPIRIIEVGISDRVACMVHLIVSYIDTDMGYIASCIVGTVEKD